MSKLLVSDYDGTYKNSTSNINDNNYEVKQLMIYDDLFMLSTGRNYEEFYEELKKYSIVANYFSFSDGNVLMDKDMRVLSYNGIPEDFYKAFKEFYNYFESVELINAYGEVDTTDIVEYRIRYRNQDAKELFKKYLIEHGIFSYHHSGDDPMVIHIYNPYTNKVTNIEQIVFIKSLDRRDVYTIGDGYNDLEMIKKYNGYSVPTANEDIKYVAKGIYDSVGEFAHDIRIRKI